MNRFTIEQVRAMGKVKKPRKSKAEHLARFLATPPAPVLTPEAKAAQQALFERHDTAVVSIRLPLAPGVNNYRTIFQARDRYGRACGRPRLITSAEGRAYCEAVGRFWTRHYEGWPPETLTGRLRLLVFVSMARNGHSDLDNRVKPLQDAMKEAGVYQDDSQIDDLRVIRGPVCPPTGAMDFTIETIS